MQKQGTGMPRAEKQLTKMTYKDRVAQCILEIQDCEKKLNKKLSELNKLLKEGGGLTLQNPSYPQQGPMGYY